MGALRPRPGSLGLRGRTAVALVIAVTAACVTLTVATTGWAADHHRRNQERELVRSARVDMQRLFAALADRPGAQALGDLAQTVWSSEGWNDRDGTGEAILIPLENQVDPVPVDRAIQWGFVNFTDPLNQRYPECLHPREWARFATLQFSDNSGQLWTEACGPYQLAYGFAQPGNGVKGKPWLVVRALYLPNEADDDPVPALRTTLLLWSAAVVAVSALVALTVAGTVIRPVTRAGAMANAVADGDLSVRVPVTGHDDVATMSIAINTTADRLTGQIADLERANETQRRFVSDVAHELRTPTSALLASAEALRDPGSRDQAAALVAPQLETAGVADRGPAGDQPDGRRPHGVGHQPDRPG